MQFIEFAIEIWIRHSSLKDHATIEGFSMGGMLLCMILVLEPSMFTFLL